MWQCVSSDGRTHFLIKISVCRKRFRSRKRRMRWRFPKSGDLGELMLPCSCGIHWRNIMQYQTVYNSPIGNLKLVSDGDSLIGLHFTADRNHGADSTPVSEPSVKPFPEAIRQLDEYFCGTRTVFEI